MKVLFIVTARGGSKGVPRKNIRMIGKLPLIAYKVIAAQKCKFEKRIIISTDDEEIAAIGKEYGGEVPFMRPAELATDTASSMDVISHAVSWVEEHDQQKYDYICMLEPSSPFASYKDFDAALELIESYSADTLLGMKKVDVSSAFIHTLDENGKLSNFYRSIRGMQSVRRQDQIPEYTMNGCMYVARWDYFKEYGIFHSDNSIPYIMSEELSVEIDSMLSYELACLLVDKGLIDTSLWMRGEQT